MRRRVAIATLTAVLVAGAVSGKAANRLLANTRSDHVSTSTGTQTREVVGTVNLTVRRGDVRSIDVIPNALVTIFDDSGFQVQVRTGGGGKAVVDLPATPVAGQDGHEEYRLYTFEVSVPNFKQLIEQDIFVVPDGTIFLDLPMIWGEGKWLRKNPKTKDHPGIRFDVPQGN